MIKPTDLTNRIVGSVEQPRPFDINEPSERAPVPTAEELDPSDPVSPPGEHAERQHNGDLDDLES